MSYTCDYCGAIHLWPISAALCCDAISNDWIDTDLDGSTIERGID